MTSRITLYTTGIRVQIVAVKSIFFVMPSPSLIRIISARRILPEPMIYRFVLWILSQTMITVIEILQCVAICRIGRGLNRRIMYSTFFSSVAGPTYCKLLDLSIHDTLQPEFVLPMFDSTKFWPSSIFHDEDPVMRTGNNYYWLSYRFRNIILWFFFATNNWLDNELKFQCTLK